MLFALGGLGVLHRAAAERSQWLEVGRGRPLADLDVSVQARNICDYIESPIGAGGP